MDAFLAFLADDVLFRFGNAEAAIGKEVVRSAVKSFFESIRELRHDVVEIWEQPDVVICHGLVTYTRHDSSTLTVPFANVLKWDGDLIKDYLIFADISELHNNG